MKLVSKICIFFTLCPFYLLFGLTPSDQIAIEGIVQNYAHAWNEHEGRGFGNDFSEYADFVNIFGMHFSGRNEIEERHLKILQGFLKGSILTIENVRLREAQPGIVVALVRWTLDGQSIVESEQLGKIRQGIFTQLFIYTGDKWEISASQNTLIVN